MNKLLKYALIGAGGLVGLVIVAIAVITATFNPNDYKPLIVKMVKEKKQRTLNIEGDIKLAFWPKLGADLGKVTLSEHNGDKEFAGVQSAKVFLSVMPLLKKELVVDTVKIDGVHANIVRYKDGTTNFDDLMSKEESQEIKFDIDGIQVTNAALNLTDEMGNRHLAIQDMQLTTGHVAKNQPIDLKTSFAVKADNPAIDAKVQLKGTVLADSEHKAYGMQGLDFALQGDVTSIKAADLKVSGDLDAKPEAMEYGVDKFKLALKANLSGQQTSLQVDIPSLSAHKDEVTSKEARLELNQTKGDDKLNAKVVVANLSGSPKNFQSSGVSGEIDGKQGARSLSGKFNSPFTGSLDSMVFDLAKLVGNVDIKDPALPNGAMKTSFDLTAHADVKQEQAKVTLSANLDGSQLKGNVAVAGFGKPNVKFDLNADQIDLNKLLGNQKAAKAPASTAPAKAPDLSALKNLIAQGTVNVGSIVYDKYRIGNLSAAIKADGQALNVSPLSLKLDDSQIKGSVGITHFEKALYTFDLDIDKIDADRYAPPAETKTASNAPSNAPAKPLDLSALKALNATGSLRVGSLKYGKVQGSNIRIDLKADGEKLKLDPFSAKIDDSQVKAVLGISRFQSPHFDFDVDIDKLDADRYVTKSAPNTKTTGDTPLDLSALKSLDASGEARLGWLKVANIKTSNVKVGLKAEGGQVNVSPFSANLYDGSMAGNLHLDARSTPAIQFKQDMKSINVGPLLVDALNNDMLEGKGTLAVDIKTQGATVGALKKALNGNASLVLADGAVKGIDIAGTVRDIKSKFNFKGNSIGADQKKRTDFSEMTATFKITNGVAHNDDLSMKSPLLRVAGSGDIDIGNETLNYVAKPTVVASLKGQGGADLGALNGLTFPVKVTGTFSAPKYGLDYSAIGSDIAKKGLLDKVGGGQGGAVQNLIGGNPGAALQGLVGGNQSPSSAGSATDAGASQAQPQGQPQATTPGDKAKKKLNKLLGL